MKSTTKLKRLSPKYLEIAGHIRREISSGALRSGDRIATVAEYCAAFKVSATAVNRALFLLDQEGLITRRQGKGNFVATALAKKGPTIVCIGFKFEEVRTVPFNSQILHGIQLAAERSGGDFLVTNQVRAVNWDKAQAAIIHSVHVDEIIAEKPAGMPAVSLMIPTTKARCVRGDDFGGARMAAKHLIGLGHRRIAYLVNPNGPQTIERVAGYKSALDEAGIRFDPRWIRPFDDTQPLIETARAVMTEFLQNDWNEVGCTAVMGQNDLTAIGAMQALADSGLKVPEAVSVVGFDDTDECVRVDPQLTSIHIPLVEIGNAAGENVLRQLSGEQVTMATLTLPASLVHRASSGPAAAYPSPSGHPSRNGAYPALRGAPPETRPTPALRATPPESRPTPALRATPPETGRVMHGGEAWFLKLM